MRVVIQRVDRASVAVDGDVVSETGKGLLIYVGIEKGDSEKELKYISEKVAGYRIFPDSEGRMNRSVCDIDGEILSISQFTLAAIVKNGKRPDFGNAEEPEKARELYNSFLVLLREHCEVKDGVFGAHMEISSVNNGPVTFIIEKKFR